MNETLLLVAVPWVAVTIVAAAIWLLLDDMNEK